MSKPTKYKITASEELFAGREAIQTRIPEGPTRILTQDKPSVDVTLTYEQALSVEQAGYKVSPSPSTKSTPSAEPPSKTAESPTKTTSKREEK